MSLLFLGLVLGSTPSVANPGSMFPQVSVGENPHRSFGGSVAGDTAQPIYTVPSGQELIVTMVATSTAGVSASRSVIHGFDFLADSDVVLSGYLLATGSKKASIVRGDGRLRVPEGTTLYARLQGPGSGDYYVQGFLVASGSPYRSYNGATASSTTTIMTADADRDFVVRTVVTDCPATGGSASVLVGGLAVVPDSTDVTALATWDEGFQAPFVQGRGGLVVPAGQTLGLHASPPCDYYIDGQYVTP